MEAEIIDDTDIAKEGQGEADAIALPELVRKLGDLDFREVGENGNGTVNMLYRLYGDHIAFKVYGATADDIVAGSRSMEGEAGHPTPGPAHNEGRVAASVLNGAADEGVGLGLGFCRCAKVKRRG